MWCSGKIAHPSFTYTSYSNVLDKSPFQRDSDTTLLTFWRWNYFFNFSTPCIKMWIIQEPDTLELWNKLHFEEEKWTVYAMFKIFSIYICWIYKIQRLEVSGAVRPLYGSFGVKGLICKPRPKCMEGGHKLTHRQPGFVPSSFWNPQH